jgi:hypothetical protein
MEPEDSLSYSQELSSEPYAETDNASQHSHIPF